MKKVTRLVSSFFLWGQIRRLEERHAKLTHLNHMKEVDEFIAKQKETNARLSTSLDNISTDLSGYVERVKKLEAGATGLSAAQKTELAALVADGEDLAKRVEAIDVEHPEAPAAGGGETPVNA